MRCERLLVVPYNKEQRPATASRLRNMSAQALQALAVGPDAGQHHQACDAQTETKTKSVCSGLLYQSTICINSD